MSSLLALFTKWSLVFADMTFIASFFSLICAQSGIAFTGFLPWIGLFTLSLVLSAILLEKGVQFNIYLALNGVLGVVTGAWVQSFLTFTEVNLMARALFILLSVIPVVHGAVMAFREVPRRLLIIYFDVSLLGALVSVALMDAGLQGLGIIMPILALFTIGLLLLNLVARRLETPTEEGGNNRKILGVVLIFATLALVLFFSYLFAGTLEDASTGLVNALIAFVVNSYRFIVWIITVIFNFLASLFPEAYGAPSFWYDAQLHWVLEETDVEEGNPVLMISIASVLLVALIAFIIWRFWGVKVKLPGRKKGRKKQRRTSHLGRGLKEFFLSIFVRIAFEVKYLFSHNSPSGLFVWTERHRARRRKGESPRSYLERIGKSGEEDLLSTLVKVLESTYYSPSPLVLPPHFARDYRKRMKVSLRVRIKDALKKKPKA
ncbi:MAG: hypothetical protein KBS81_09705 [Spirochaetales bacterium]|nr:hypothetical protein [Candidatus Physcosoma equi]